MLTGRTSQVILIALGLLSLPFCATADSAMTVWALDGGTYNWNGSGSLTGSNIGASTVFGLGTPSGSVLSISDGFLNFVSGAWTGSGWNWNGGGTLNLTGCIAGVTAASCNGSNNVTLLSDDFQSISVSPIPGLRTFDVVFGNVVGQLNSSLANYFGIGDDFTVATFATAITTGAQQGAAFTGSGLGGVIDANGTVSMAESWGIFSDVSFFVLALLIFAIAQRCGILPKSQYWQGRNRQLDTV